MGKKEQSIEHVNPSIEIDEHLAMHKTGWKAQRAGVVFIFLVITLAALGLFGDGWISQKTLETPSATVVFERFYRAEKSMVVEVDITNSSEVSIVSFPNHYLKKFEIKTILPEPQSNKVSGNLVHYTFRGNGRVNARFFMIPKYPGTVEGSIRVNEQVFSVHHFIFP